MRYHFDLVIRNIRNYSEEQFRIETFLYLSYWYASLYVLVEGWRELGFSDKTIDALLDSSNVDLLKRYRHGVFHFQKEYYDSRFIQFMSEGQDVVVWVRQLTEAFSGYFLRETKKTR